MTSLFYCPINLATTNLPRLDDYFNVASVYEKGKIQLLSLDKDEDTNRSVLFLKGNDLRPLKLFLKDLISLNRDFCLSEYQSIHPHVGLVDLIPLIPIDYQSYHLAVQHLGQLIEEFMDILPNLFLYELASNSQQIVSLPALRKLINLNSPELTNHSALTRYYNQSEIKKVSSPLGSTIMGVRKPLIAFNVTLESEDNGAAKRIANKIRESNKKTGVNGVRAIGWHGLTVGIQVACNLYSNLKITGGNLTLKLVFDKITQEAHNMDSSISSSELIGMVDKGNLGFGEESEITEIADYLKIEREILAAKILDFYH